jgi:hypothetical protein
MQITDAVVGNHHTVVVLPWQTAAILQFVRGQIENLLEAL